MLNELKRAEKFIFMEYFIVTESYMWNTILEILKEKVRQGVEVRFMYDGMCSLKLLPYGYYKELEKFGIKSRAFSQLKPVLSTYQNNRDHRKILVIDGKVAFTGGINLADEYINKEVRFGHWKDTAVMVKGKAVRSFTLMFLKMWNLSKKEKSISKDELYEYVDSIETPLPADEDESKDLLLHRGGNVTPYGDNPFSRERIGRQVYIDILNRAKEYVHIMTPYLILDDEMLSALTYCAKRGVETIIIMPHIPDKKYAFLLAHTYYKELIENGVKIYEYTPGFVHAKVFVSDGIRASIGTINLDFRSLYLHFECAAYIYKNGAVKDVEADYQNTLKDCGEVTMDMVIKYPLRHRIAGQLLRIIAPLM
ncbi:MAG: phospholipase D-like domain-containing protein, partial [Eubacteriales bacterium]|nr:phospholipase D-like domain-containing protein [Eubacteriales bacterium]